MILSNKDYFSDDVKANHWLGEVIENKDPENLGRIKIKVFGKFDLLNDDDIPWAEPSNQNTGGSASGGGTYSSPKLTSIVNVYFDMGNIYMPTYTFHQTINEDLRTEIGEDSENFHSLLYDTELEGGLKIFYSQNEEKGLYFNLKDTLINIKNDNSINIINPNGDIINMTNEGDLEITTSNSLTINTKETTINSENDITVNTKTSTINASDKATINTVLAEINADDKAVVNTSTAEVNATDMLVNATSIKLGDGASEALVKGNIFMSFFNSHTHVGNLGAPVSPPVSPMTPAHLSNISKTK